MSADWNELLDISMKTQTSGIPGAGSSLCFIGPPGVTKTARNRAFCDSINHHCEVIILGRIPSVDVGGIYAPDFERGVLKHMITRRLLGDIPEAEGKDGVCIFFDEFANATEEQQTAIQSIIEDRILEGNRVPDNVWYTFATNPSDANCGSHEIVRSMLDRMITVRITQEEIMKNIFPGWMEWAVTEGNIHPTITTFFQWSHGGEDGEFFHAFDPASDEMAQPNPRSWTKLSRIIDHDPTPGTLDLVGRGTVGAAAYTEYSAYVRLATELPIPEDILTDPRGASVPGQPNACYAVLSNLTAYLRKQASVSTNSVDAAITYLRRFPESFAVFGFRMMAHSHPDFSAVSNEYGRFLVDHQDLTI